LFVYNSNFIFFNGKINFGKRNINSTQTQILHLKQKTMFIVLYIHFPISQKKLSNYTIKWVYTPFIKRHGAWTFFASNCFHDTNLILSIISLTRISLAEKIFSICACQIIACHIINILLRLDFPFFNGARKQSRSGCNVSGNTHTEPNHLCKPIHTPRHRT
jgi:hypothetical protein